MKTELRAYELKVDVGRPISLNAERSAHWSKRSAAAKEWRDAAFWLAREAKLPRLDCCAVTVWTVRTKGRVMDLGNNLPSVKACIDGLVDAGVMADDTPDILVELTFRASVKGDWDGLMLRIEER